MSNKDNINLDCITCDTHSLKTEFVCLQCNVLVCTDCLVQTHNGHKIDHLRRIKQSLSTNDHQSLWLTTRMEHLWKTLQLCASSYQSLEVTSKEVSDHFEQMFKLLMAQEHKIKTPINAQMTHIQSTINNIVNEIIDINHFIINQSSSYVGGERYDQSSRDSPKLLEAIMSSTSIDQFIKMPYTQTLLLLSDDVDVDKPEPSDDELLAKIGRHALHMRQVPYDDVSTHRLQAHRIKIDVGKLDQIKKQIESCFLLIEHGRNIAQIDIPIANVNIVAAHNNDLTMLSLQSSTWATIPDALGHNHDQVFTSFVYARGNVYVFGGKDRQKKFLRYSLVDKQRFDNDISGVNGGYYISACYDGEKNIYLVGGFDQNNKMRKRVDCFNIDTQKFSKVGQLTFGLAWPTIHFHNNTIYMVGGQRTMANSLASNHRDVIAFNVRTMVTQTYIAAALSRDTSSICFDNSDSIYSLDGVTFKRHSITNKQSAQLANCPVFESHIKLWFVPSHGVLYLGGTNKNYLYSVEDNKWTLLYDHDPVPIRVGRGSCVKGN
ncbi:hypothetical protein SAMD00019534_049560, partial [Acytostelium subglobosum LB1]|uniref:hypothetical protein n=1 Tax=Acytostelium subglobosum LB1 TaxID=1410327 RepID=UPI000644C63C